MAEITPAKKGWVRRRIEKALLRGLQQAYQKVQVDPERFLLQLRNSYALPVSTYQGMFSIVPEHVDAIAADIVRSSMKVAAAGGAGLGVGGLITVVPDLGVLSAITIRMIQKLSLVYGFEYNTEAEMAELWVAAASAAGVDLSRDVLEKGLLKPFVARAIRAIAAQASKEIVEKWAARLVPVVSAVIGGGLNYYFVRAWGERALQHFHQKHLYLRGTMERKPTVGPAQTS